MRDDFVCGRLVVHGEARHFPKERLWRYWHTSAERSCTAGARRVDLASRGFAADRLSKARMQDDAPSVLDDFRSRASAKLRQWALRSAAQESEQNSP